MFQLVVYVCLLATPEECSQLPVPGATAESLFGCMKQSHKATEWQRTNSQYIVMGKLCKKQ